MAASEARLPLVTVVMPVRNEAGFIEKSVGSVLTQDYPVDRVEILVADGDSDDGTRAILDQLAARHPRLRVVPNPGRIVSKGLNAALSMAGGEIVVRVDGHCEVAPDYIRRCVAHLQAGSAEGVGGPLETVGETFSSRVIAAAMSSAFGVGGAAFRTKKNSSMLADTVAFPAYTRAIMDRAGPFDEELVRDQDDEYNYRLREMGARILLAADVRSRYYSRSSLRSLWRQYFQYGYWKVRVMQKHPAQMKVRQFAPPLFVLAVMVSIVAAGFSWVGRLAFVGIAAAYATATLVASTSVSRGLGIRGLFLLPAVFATLHLSYGLGFLTGLVRFRREWSAEGRRVGPRGGKIAGGDGT